MICIILVECNSFHRTPGRRRGMGGYVSQSCESILDCHQLMSSAFVWWHHRCSNIYNYFSSPWSTQDVLQQCHMTRQSASIHVSWTHPPVQRPDPILLCRLAWSRVDEKIRSPICNSFHREILNNCRSVFPLYPITIHRWKGLWFISKRKLNTHTRKH